MKRFFLLLLFLTLCVTMGTGSITTTLADQTNSSNKANYEAIFWESVKDSNNIKMFRAYLNKYPNGMFSELAKIQIERLENEAQNTESGDAKHWESVKNSNNIKSFRSYLKKYPNGMFAELAKIQIERLEGEAKNSSSYTAASEQRLRTTPIRLEEDEIKKMLKKNNFCDLSRNSNADFKNDFKDNENGTITDRATGLVWQIDGSWRKISRKKAHAYIDDLNRKKFAGKSNWRIPTVEELASLLENRPSGYYGLYIDPMFDKTENKNWLDRCWTSDSLKSIYGADETAWLVDFKRGRIVTGHWYTTIINQDPDNHNNYVRAVASEIQ